MREKAFFSFEVRRKRVEVMEYLVRMVAEVPATPVHLLHLNYLENPPHPDTLKQESVKKDTLIVPGIQGEVLFEGNLAKSHQGIHLEIHSVEANTNAHHDIPEAILSEEVIIKETFGIRKGVRLEDRNTNAHRDIRLRIPLEGRNIK